MFGSGDDYISVRDWRRKPPLRLARHEEAPHPMVLDRMHALSARVAIAPYIDPVGTERLAGHAAAWCPLHRVRLSLTTPIMGRLGHLAANQPDGAGALIGWRVYAAGCVIPSVTGSPPPNFQIFREWSQGTKRKGVMSREFLDG